MDNVRNDDAALPAYWVASYIGDGEKYYYNTITNETSWTFPMQGDGEQDELANVEMEDWAAKEPEGDAALQKVFEFQKKNKSYSGCKIKVMPDGEAPYEILGGTCDFGGALAAAGLDGPLFFDVFNPKAKEPFDLYRVEEQIQGAIVIVERGEVVVSEKVRHCQDAGAIGCIVANVDADKTLFNIGIPGDGTEADLHIPVTNVTFADGTLPTTTTGAGRII